MEVVSKMTAVMRGVRGECPACGRGRLFGKYLKPVEQCSHCGEAYAHYRADDAPPWMTILLVGHIVVPASLSVEQTWQPSLWLHFALWPTLTILLTLLLLPRAKGVVLALMWATGAPGTEKTAPEPLPPV